MLLILEVVMLIFGIVVLVTGKVSLSKDSIVIGPRARVVGLCWLLPLPLAFCVGFIIGMYEGMNGRQFDITKWGVIIGVTELGFVVFFGILGLVIANTGEKLTAKELARRKRLQDQYAYDDDFENEDDDRDAPRRRRRVDDEDDERPRSRSESDQVYERDDNPRPRRKPDGQWPGEDR